MSQTFRRIGLLYGISGLESGGSGDWDKHRGYNVFYVFCVFSGWKSLTLCKVFNEKTNDGKKMDFYSKLLEKSIESIVEIKDKKDVDSLFSSGGTTINKLKSLNDFELICFFVIEEDLC